MAQDPKAGVHLSQRTRHVHGLSMYAHAAHAQRQHDQYGARDQHDRRSGATSVPHHFQKTAASRDAGTVKMYAFASGVKKKKRTAASRRRKSAPAARDAPALATGGHNSNSQDYSSKMMPSAHRGLRSPAISGQPATHGPQMTGDPLNTMNISMQSCER